jgi:hypothetical protein
MNEFTLVMGAAMTAFVFINFFVKSWGICLIIILLAVGTCASIASNVNQYSIYLLLATALLAVVEVVTLIITKHRNP